LKKRKPAETREVKKPRLETKGQHEGSIVNNGIRKSTRLSGKVRIEILVTHITILIKNYSLGKGPSQIKWSW
jgi:hypothetical protein